MVVLPNGEKSLRTCLFVSTQYANVTDTRTDRQTDRQTDDEHRTTGTLMHDVSEILHLE